jgi:hypothetical protein
LQGAERGSRKVPGKKKTTIKEIREMRLKEKLGNNQ